MIFDQSGAALATAANTGNAFTPQSKDDWKTVTYNLAGFVGQNNAQIALVGINHYGNNLYIDNVRVLTEDYENLTVEKLVASSPVTNRNNSVPQLQISNAGTAISSFDITYGVNGSSHTVTYSGDPINFGETVMVKSAGGDADGR